MTAELPDRYWRAAAEAAELALREARWVLVPELFLGRSERFVPLEFSWGIDPGERYAWCCPKDDVQRVAPWLRDAAATPHHFCWANEVFVIGANFTWRRIDSRALRQHLGAWQVRVDRHRRGVPVGAAPERVRLPECAALDSARAPRVLLVGASGMGNVGDDLLADVVAGILTDEGAEVSLAGPDIDPLRIQVFDAVVVGGGGLVYASRDGANESQNLANYLKFGPIARASGIPVAMIGVGDQDHAKGIAWLPLAAEFSRRCLAQFECLTTRDRASAELLGALGTMEVAASADLLFHWRARARDAVRPTGSVPARVALIGEVFDYAVFAVGLGDGRGPLADRLGQTDYEVLVMSNDDQAHAARLREALLRCGASATLVDLRGRTFESLVFLFASYRSVITTRFHGLVLAALAGAPVGVLDVPDGKKARLCRELGSTALLLDTTASTAAFDGLVAAIGGELMRVAEVGLVALEHATHIHVDALRRLVNSPARPSGAAPGPDRGRARRDGRNVTVSPAELLDEAGSVNLCWAASSTETDGYANLGDALSAVVVCALAGVRVRHRDFDEPIAKLVAVGSIGHAIRNGVAVVWGSGVSVRTGMLANNAPVTGYDVRAMRGPISARHYRDFGISVPETYGDPVWLLPAIFSEPVEKRYDLGVIPHIHDVAGHHPDALPRADSMRYQVSESERGSIVIINTWHPPDWDGLIAKLRLILSCRRILSQSFHGLVIAEAYGIPVLNFRHVPGVDRPGVHHVDLRSACTVDPRVFEFYQSAPRSDFPLYAQRRDARTDWSDVVHAIDTYWAPFEYDPGPMLQAFPLPLAFDPRRERLGSQRLLRQLTF